VAPGEGSTPPPPPPPPASLVQLIQSDQSVLRYFTLLQANLEADKQKWKHRAEAYRRECEDLKKKISGFSSNQSWKSTEVEEEKATSEGGEMNGTIAEVDKIEEEKGHYDEVLGAIYEEMSSGEDEDDKKNEECLHPFQEVFPQRLQEANDNLEQLGVFLVQDGQRRRDADVAADLMGALRAVTRLQMQKVKEEHRKKVSPFVDMTPGCDCTNHPAYQAKLLAFSALRIMDLFCTEMDDDEWKHLTTSGHDSLASLGMRSRHDFVEQLMQSLSVEISEMWPVSDRTSRRVSTALHFDCLGEQTSEEAREIDKDHFGLKSQSRLSTIVERCLLTQLVVHYFDYRNEAALRMNLFYKYVLAAAPSLQAEEYPRFPPVFSICVMEAIITSRQELTNSYSVFDKYDETHTMCLDSAAAVMHLAAWIWKERMKSSDDRISDIARVQLASYHRILQQDYVWVGQPLKDSADIVSIIRNKGLDQKNCVFALSVYAIMAQEGLDFLKLSVKDDITTAQASFGRALACSVALRQLHIRRLDLYREGIGTSTSSNGDQEEYCFLSRIEEVLNESTSCDKTYWLGKANLLKSHIFLSNGEHSVRLAESMVESEAVESGSRDVMIDALRVVKWLNETPLVRVINLRRRIDRRRALQCQALFEKFLVVNAVAELNPIGVDKSSHFWGAYAFDGRAKSVDASQTYVKSHWRPSDLMAFDDKAPDDDRLVEMSPTERACALSHIASWEGIRRSLEPPVTCGLFTFPYKAHVQQLFRISGFARGKALLEKNESMPAAPVCVILEDDAILVERFVERLEELLDELPRDFHFCSLGYSRPKTAPILPFSSQVGIPTCVWYLTGYLLSLEGARYLMNKLPIQGPVDSWIGLMMCANFDNSYGHVLGVGMPSKAISDLPSRKDLGQILTFRAFCANAPLCSQRVGLGATNSARNWRQRDTDIDYSGF
jgi:hypothetical protein